MPNEFFGDPGGFFAPIHAKIEKRHEEEEGLKKEKRKQFFDMANNPELSDEVRNWAAQEHQRMLNPQIGKKLKQHTPMLRSISAFFGKGGKQPSQDAGEPQGPPTDVTPEQFNSPEFSAQPPAAKPAQSTGTGGPVGPPSKIYDTPAANERALEGYRQKALIDQQRQIAVAGAKPPVVANKKQVQYASPDGKEVVSLWQDPKTLQVFTAQGEPAEVPEGYKPYKAPAAGTRKQYLFKDAEGKERIVFQDSKTQAAYDARGNSLTIPEDWEPVDEQGKLAKLRADSYGTGAFNTWKKTYMAKYPEASEEEAERMAAERVELSLNRTDEQKGATTTPAVTMIDPETGQVKQLAPVRNVNPLPPNGQPQPVSPPVLQERGAPVAGRPAAAAKPVPPPTASSSGGRTVGLNPSQYRMAQQDIRSVLDAAIPVFGSPESGVKGMDAFAGLASSKEAKGRLGVAFQMAELLGDDIGSAKIGVGGESGINISLGSVGKILEQRLGIPTELAEQRAKTLQATIGAMTKEEREYYNAVIAARESIVGLRKATSGSSAKYAVDAMQKALPEIGVNVFDADGYRNMMDRQAEIFSGALGGMVTGAMSSAQKRRMDEIQKRQKSGAGRPSGPPGPVAVPKAAAPVPPPPKVGDVVDGFRYKGGDPAKQESWEASAKKTGTK